MRLAFRALLLATGCAVMVATSPAGGPENYPPILIPAGGTLQLELSATSPDGGKVEVQPLLSLSVEATVRPPVNAPPPRFVGFASLTPPSADARDRLDPKASFTQDQQVEGLGTVNLLDEVPLYTDFIGRDGIALRFSAPGSIYLTLYSPDVSVTANLEIAISQMELQCQCTVTATIEGPTSPSTPDAGTDGRDGG